MKLTRRFYRFRLAIAYFASYIISISSFDGKLQCLDRGWQFGVDGEYISNIRKEMPLDMLEK